ncbi:Cytochrome P450 4C1 [Gryllus bimaculatus]|nr:Cytochrome P450 4C1 [Gryllus bimaculatus]
MAVTVTLATSLTCASAVLLPLLVLLAALMWARGAEERRRLRRCGEQIPGPRPLPLIGNLLDVGLDTKKLHESAIRFFDQYGNTFRVWAGPFRLLVNLAEPSDIEALLSKSKNLNKSFNYEFLHPWLGLGLLTATGERWKKHRKIITPTFHFTILEQFVDVFNKQGNILISILKRKEGEGPFDIVPLIDLYTQDVICETAMGVELHSQTEGYASSYLQCVKNMCELLMKRSSRPWLFPNFVYRLSSLRRQEQKHLKILHGMTNEVIRRRRKQLQEDPTLFEENIDELGRKRKLAFLDLLLYSTLNGDMLSDKDIREEVDTFMFEGHDTTASGISFALYELSQRPDIQSEEISLNLEVLNKLKYLDQVIKETLRMYPSVPIFGREITEDLYLPSGQKFAMLEMKAVLSKIIWNFSLQIDPTFEMKVVSEITLKSQYGVRLSAIRRTHN